MRQRATRDRATNHETVLVVEPTRDLARQTAERVTAAGAQPFVAESATEIRENDKSFDRGIFAFDLPDGSGIVLAAEMILQDRVGDVEFIHPDDEAAMQGGASAPVALSSGVESPSQSVE